LEKVRQHAEGDNRVGPSGHQSGQNVGPAQERTGPQQVRELGPGVHQDRSVPGDSVQRSHRKNQSRPIAKDNEVIMRSSIERFSLFSCVVVFAWTCFGIAESLAAEQKRGASVGTLILRVRDSLTGYAIPGAVVAEGSSGG